MYYYAARTHTPASVESVINERTSNLNKFLCWFFSHVRAIIFPQRAVMAALDSSNRFSIKIFLYIKKKSTIYTMSIKDELYRYRRPNIL